MLQFRAVVIALILGTIPSVASGSCPSIAQKYAAMGGAGGILGAPTSQVQPTRDGRGRFQTYENGAIYWSKATCAHWIKEPFLSKWVTLNDVTGPLGFPTSDIENDGSFDYYRMGSFPEWITFQKGRIYYRPSYVDEPRRGALYAVYGAIWKKYADFGAHRGLLGFPRTDELPLQNGRYNDFQNGSIYWSQATGAHEVHGTIRDCWLRLGAAAGPLGYPRSDEIVAPDQVGRFSKFEHGAIYWTEMTGAHDVRGAILEAWGSVGWERGVLGYPRSGETAAPDGRGRFNIFEHGSIYWTPTTGAHEVRGAIRDTWATYQWERGRLGYPRTNETSTPDGVGRFNHFEGGSIYWTAGTGARAVYGPIRDKWEDLGWERSCLGYPRTEQYEAAAGRQVQEFQRGQISLVGGTATHTCQGDNQPTPGYIGLSYRIGPSCGTGILPCTGYLRWTLTPIAVSGTVGLRTEQVINSEYEYGQVFSTTNGPQEVCFQGNAYYCYFDANSPGLAVGRWKVAVSSGLWTAFCEVDVSSGSSTVHFSEYTSGCETGAGYP